MRTLCGCVDECVNAKGHRKEKHKIPRNLVRRRRRKIRRIPVQRRRYRSWASPGPAKRRRYLAAVYSKVGGWAFCGRTPCLLVWLRRRTLDEAPSGQSTEMHRGHAGLSAGSERMNLIDHGRNLRASLPSVSAIGDPLYQICDLLSYVGVPTLVTKRWGLPESDGGRG